jgi:hypothetical protein
MINEGMQAPAHRHENFALGGIVVATLKVPPGAIV